MEPPLFSPSGDAPSHAPAAAAASRARSAAAGNENVLSFGALPGTPARLGDRVSSRTFSPPPSVPSAIARGSLAASVSDDSDASESESESAR